MSYFYFYQDKVRRGIGGWITFLVQQYKNLARSFRYSYVYGIPPQQVYPFLGIYKTNAASYPFGDHDKNRIEIENGVVSSPFYTEENDRACKVNLNSSLVTIQTAILCDKYNGSMLDVTDEMMYLQIRNNGAVLPLAAIQPWLYKVHLSWDIPDVSCELHLTLKDCGNNKKFRHILKMQDLITF